MVLVHSYRLSPLGPALQLVGGSREISANSFWMRFALLDSGLLMEPIWQRHALGGRAGGLFCSNHV